MNVNVVKLPQDAKHSKIDFVQKEEEKEKHGQFCNKLPLTDEPMINMHQNDMKRCIYRKKGNAHDPLLNIVL